MSCGCSNFVDEEYDEFFGLFDRGRRRRKGGVSSERRVKKRIMPTMDCDCEECAKLRAMYKGGKGKVIDTLLEPKPLPIVKPKPMMYGDPKPMPLSRRECRKKYGIGKDFRDCVKYGNFVEGDDFMVIDESTFNANGLSTFDGGGRMMDLGVDDIENADESYDNFLTKKMRERRRVKKTLMEGGLDRKEAKQVALEQVPRTTLKEFIAKIKQGGDTDNVGGVDLTGLSEDEKADLVNQALRGSGLVTQTETDGRVEMDADDDANNVKAGFFEENQTTMILVGLTALAVVGYFAFGKKLGIRK
jgi:hypothetical protein